MENTNTGTNTSKSAYNTFSQMGINETDIPRVETMKATAAVLWDQFDNINTNPDGTASTYADRMVSIAKTKLEESVMWATKAFSRK